MRKTITIRSRVLMTVAGVFIASSVIMAAVVYTSQRSQFNKTIREEIKNDVALFPLQVEAEAEGLARALAGFTRLDALLKPFAEKNHDALLAVAKPIFESIKANNNITHMYFIEPDGTVLLRVHKPEQQGDKVSRITFRRASETGRLSSGIEMGKNFFSLRAVHPVTYQGSPIGYLELGQEIDHIFKRMSETTGDDVSVFLTNDFLKARSAELKKETMGDFMLLDSTHKEAALALAQQVELKAGLSEFVLSTGSVGGTKHVIGMGPLKGCRRDCRRRPVL